MQQKASVMKRMVLIVGLLALFTGVDAQKSKDVISKEEGSVTFYVDRDVNPASRHVTTNGDKFIRKTLRDKGIKNDIQRVVASSFADDDFCDFGMNAFFDGMVDAYAGHHAVTLSPDAIWLLISQGFAYWVNDNPEEMRKMLVDHNGKMGLVVETTQTLSSGQVKWDSIVNVFSNQMREHTKNGIVDLMTADFTTTGPVERMVTQATIMESLKSYFEYIIIETGCGIPQITLTGTTRDWERVLEKTLKLREFGLGWWVDELEPILKEFIDASKGSPNAEFWQDIVIKMRPDMIRGGECLPINPTYFDGWFLKLMPFDKTGRTPESVLSSHEFRSQIVTTEFKYIIDNEDGTIVTINMELCSGFVGMEQDEETFGYTPKLGWFIRVAQTEDEMVEETKMLARHGGIILTLSSDVIPDYFRQIDYFFSLEIYFPDKVVIPEWMDSTRIERLQLHGNITKEEAVVLKERFPQAWFQDNEGRWY